MQFGIQPKTGGTYHGLCSIIVTTKQCTEGPACLSDLQNLLKLSWHSQTPSLLFLTEYNKSKITLLINESYKHLIINHKNQTSNTALLIVSLLSTERF